MKSIFRFAGLVIFAAGAVPTAAAEEVNLARLADSEKKLTITASSSYSSYSPAKLADGDLTTMAGRWVSSDANENQWVAFAFADGWHNDDLIKLSSYTLSSVGVSLTGANSAASCMPKDWTLEGQVFADDGEGAWVTIDTRTNEDWSEYESVAEGTAFGRTFTIAAPSAYRAFRLKFSARSGGPITESYAYQLTEVGLNGSFVSVFGRKTDVGAYLKRTGLLVCDATSAGGSTRVGNLFDGDRRGNSGGEKRWYSDGSTTQKILFSVDSSNEDNMTVRLTEYGLYSVKNSNTGSKQSSYRMPKAWMLEGSNVSDDSGWEIVDEHADEDWSAYNGSSNTEVIFGQTYTVEHPGNYHRYRLTLSERYGDMTGDTIAYMLTEIKLSGIVSKDSKLMDIVGDYPTAFHQSITATSEPLQAYPVTKLLDGDTSASGRWLSSADTNQTVTIEMNTAASPSRSLQICEYRLTSVGVNVLKDGNRADRMPSAWTFEGCDTNSEDDSDWTVLDRRSNVSWAEFDSVAVDKVFSQTFAVAGANRKVFKYLRLRFTARYRDIGSDSYAYQLSGLRIRAKMMSGMMILLR